jgi:membrane-bound inhibitor of C-type lysozyme
MSLAAKLPYNHPFAGGYPGLGSQPLPSDSDALAYLGAVAAADGAGVEVSVALAVDGFFRDCKAAGIFDAIKASCILCGARTLSGALVPLAGPTITNSNFVSADYVRGGATPGLKGNTSTKALTVSNAYTPVQDSAHQAIYVSVKSSAISLFYTHIREMDDAGVAGDGQTQISQSGGATFTRCRESGGDTRSVTPSVGFVGISRNGSASYTLRDAGVEVTVSDASDGIPDGTVHVFTNGQALQYSDARLAFWSVGEAVDLEDLDDAVSALVTAIGAAI